MKNEENLGAISKIFTMWHHVTNLPPPHMKGKNLLYILVIADKLWSTILAQAKNAWLQRKYRARG